MGRLGVVVEVDHRIGVCVVRQAVVRAKEEAEADKAAALEQLRK
jgi:hypothetical protein